MNKSYIKLLSIKLNNQAYKLQAFIKVLNLAERGKENRNKQEELKRLRRSININ